MNGRSTLTQNQVSGLSRRPDCEVGNRLPASAKEPSSTGSARKSTSLPRFSRNRFFHSTLAVSALALTAFMVVMLRVLSMSVPAGQLTDIGTAVVPAALAAIYCHWRGFEKLREGALIVMWACVMSRLLMFPMYAAARLHFPLRDNLFAVIDHRFGMEVPIILNWMTHHPALNALLSYSYDALFPLMVVAVIVPAVGGKLTAAKEFVVANLVAAVIGTCAFAFVPGVGPWTVYKFPPAPDQRLCAAMVHALREQGQFRIDLNYSSGLICFPSFHVILAILSAAALWSFRPLRPFAAIVCALVVVSAVTTGWHYVIDVLGGILFAAASIAAAKAFTRLEARFQ